MEVKPFLWLLVPVFLILTPVTAWLIARKQASARNRLGCLVGGFAPFLFFALVMIVTTMKMDNPAVDTLVFKFLGSLLDSTLLIPGGFPVLFLGLCLICLIGFTLGSRTTLLEWLGYRPEARQRAIQTALTGTCPQCGKPLAPNTTPCPNCGWEPTQPKV